MKFIIKLAIIFASLQLNAQSNPDSCYLKYDTKVYSEPDNKGKVLKELKASEMVSIVSIIKNSHEIELEVGYGYIQNNVTDCDFTDGVEFIQKPIDSNGVFVNGYDLSDFKGKYIKISLKIDGFTNRKLRILVNYGQKEMGEDDRLIDASGEPLNFNNLIHALNFFAERGWIFRDAQEYDRPGYLDVHYLLERLER